MRNTHLHRQHGIAPAPEPLGSEAIKTIALRAVWNPVNVSPAELQVLAASVLAHLRGPQRHTPDPLAYPQGF